MMERKGSLDGVTIINSETVDEATTFQVEGVDKSNDSFAQRSFGLALADDRLVLAAGAGQLLVSADRGRTFRLAAIGADKTATVTGLWQAADGGVLLTSDKGVLRLELADLKMEAAK